MKTLAEFWAETDKGVGFGDLELCGDELREFAEMMFYFGARSANDALKHLPTEEVQAEVDLFLQQTVYGGG